MPLPPNDPFIVHEDYIGQPYQSVQMLVKRPGTSSCLPNPLQRIANAQRNDLYNQGPGLSEHGCNAMKVQVPLAPLEVQLQQNDLDAILPKARNTLDGI